MKLLPVLDIMNGTVVRGVAGRRSNYRPVVSRLVASSNPVAVAKAFRMHFELDQLYLADLDAIAGGEPSLPVYRDLKERGFHLWVDAGVRDRARADLLAKEGLGIVVGLETITGPTALADIVKAYGERIVFSLDLRNGIPMGDRSGWADADAETIAKMVIQLGIRRILVLDVARVGIGQGAGTEPLLAGLGAAYPSVEVWAGGGVRGVTDLVRLRDLGLKAVLVASALHDGSLTREQLATFLRG